MQLLITAVPLSIRDREFNGTKYKEVLMKEVLPSGQELTFKINTTDKDYIDIFTKNLYKEIKDIPCFLLPVGNYFKLKLQKEK